jgi:hypothetical protein
MLLLKKMRKDFTVECVCVCVCEALRFSDAPGRHAVSQKNGDDG